MTATSFSGEDGDRLARRNAVILALSQAFAGAQATIVFSVGALAGSYLLLDDKSLATLPPTAFLIGTAFGTIPASQLMRIFGRRSGFILGLAFGICGALIAMQAVLHDIFWMLCLGTGLTGFANAFVQQFRFAAADTATEGFRPKAISWVMAGGVAAGVIGPQTAAHFKDLFDPIPFAGAFLGQAVLIAIAIVILILLRAPPVARASRSAGRPTREIISQPRFIISVLCAITSYAIMSFVMTAAPLAMVACGHTPSDAIYGIQWHVMAMFAPSFFTGHLIARFGKETIVSVGVALLTGCAIVALIGIELSHFYVALILLGIGWNFGFIGATAMVTECYRPEERERVQGINDFFIFGFVGFASFMAGKLHSAFGWTGINLTVLPFVALAFCLLGWLAWDRRRIRRAAAV